MAMGGMGKRGGEGAGWSWVEAEWSWVELGGAGWSWVELGGGGEEANWEQGESSVVLHTQGFNNFLEGVPSHTELLSLCEPVQKTLLTNIWMV